jgi:xylulokinase
MIFLGIDCGTQSTKVVALDDQTGTLLAQASKAHGLLPGLPPGHMEQNPSDWTDALDESICKVVEMLGDRRQEIVGIGVSGQQHGFVPLDDSGRVIRPAKLWCDTSTAPQCDEIRVHLGGTGELIRLLGNDMLPGFTAPKILWLKQNEPQNFKKLAQVLLPHDYLNFYLTGSYSMEYGDASGTALLDVRARRWCKPVLDYIDSSLESKLPPLQSSRKAAGLLKPELAKKWGLKSGILVSAGGGDNMMGAIGTGNVRAGRVTASLGTSGTIYAYAEKPVIDPDGEIAAFCDSTDSWLPLLCTMNVTVATEAVGKLFSLDHKALNQTVSSVAPGADGLLFLPYLSGERTPNLPNGSGVLHGLNLHNFTQAHFARAVMEGATLGLAYGLQRLRTLGISPTEIRLTGGGSKSPVWRQLCADIFNCPVVTLQSAEGAALGSAIQALALVRTEKSVADWADHFAQPNTAEAVAPQKNGFDYAALLDKQTRLMKTLRDEKFL